MPDKQLASAWFVRTNATAQTTPPAARPDAGETKPAPPATPGLGLVAGIEQRRAEYSA